MSRSLVVTATRRTTGVQVTLGFRKSKTLIKAINILVAMTALEEGVIPRTDIAPIAIAGQAAIQIAPKALEIMLEIMATMGTESPTSLINHRTCLEVTKAQRSTVGPEVVLAVVLGQEEALHSVEYQNLLGKSYLRLIYYKINA